jgi:hypothetical protein
VIGKRTDTSGSDGNAKYTLMMKGAPEFLINMCSTLACEIGEQDLDENEKFDFQVSQCEHLLYKWMGMGREGWDYVASLNLNSRIRRSSPDRAPSAVLLSYCNGYMPICRKT